MNLETFNYSVDADGVAHVVFDVPGRSMNTLTAKVMAELPQIVAAIRDDANVKGAVITSGKASGFCAGADLGEMGSRDTSGMSGDERLKAEFERGFSLNRTLRELETCGKPVAVAINGLALGGGLEVCLAAHYRIAASDNPRLQLGLPEAKVGLLPGGGGTQRLPRLIGVMAAAPMLLQGQSQTAEKAKAMGIIHDTAPTAELVEKAKAWVLANPNAKAPWDEPKFRVPGGAPHTPAGAQLFSMAPAMLTKETNNNYPAQENILKCVYEGLQMPFDAAIRIESRYFLKTAATPQSKGMIRTLFLSMQALGKGASRPVGPAPFEVKKAAVLGAGLMGAGIAYEQARAGIETVLVDVSQESAEKGKAYSQRIVDKDVSRGKLTREKADAILARITPTTDYSAIAGADIVVEAVYEDPDLKARVTRMAEPHLREGGVFGSNTSTLPITGLSAASDKPENYIGIHFFSPVERMGLVEIIVGDKTSQETLAKAIDYVIAIRKTPIVVNDFRGFYTSRCFGTYTQEGMEMLAEGIAPAIIENVGRQAGMPMGPLEVSDSVGLDTALKIGKQMARANGTEYTNDPKGALLDWVVEAQGRAGRKAGKGFYDYGSDGKPTRLWQGLGDKIEVTVNECPPEMKKELTHRLLVRQAIEVSRCFEEGVITDARDADVGSILAWGFAPWTGGCCSYMDLFWGGLRGFVAEADRLADAHGERFRPGQMLRDMAASGETFYSRFGPDMKAAAAA